MGRELVVPAEAGRQVPRAQGVREHGRVSNYGGYEVGAKLQQGAFTAVWEARQAGAAKGSPARFAVKAFDPAGTPFSKEEAALHAESFLDSALTQHRVASSGARHWAAIHKSGTADGGAFYVTDRYDHSLQELIEGRVHLTSADVYHVLHSTLQGLAELKAAAGRPHGNLKPSNILIAGATDLGKARIVLTDPLPRADVDPAAGMVHDLQALGQALYHLVLHQPFRLEKGWPIGPSPEWGQLGKDGDAWRELCSQLLFPNALKTPLTLEAALAALAKFEPKHSALSEVRWGLWGWGAAAAIALVVLGAWAYRSGFGRRAARQLAAPPAEAVGPEKKAVVPEKKAPEPAVPEKKTVVAPDPEAEWAASVGSQPEITSSATLNQEWVRRRAGLSPQRLRVLCDFLRGLDDKEQLPEGLPDEAKDLAAEPAHKPVLAELGRRREEALAAALRAAAWGQDKAPDPSPAPGARSAAEFMKTKGWTEPRGRYLQWRETAGKVLVAAAALKGLLDAGCLPDEKPPNAAKSPRQWLAEVEGQTVPPELQPFLEPTAARLKPLLALDAMDRKGLVERASKLRAPRAGERSDDPPQVATILWRRLGEQKDWPADLAELQLELKLRDALSRVSANELAEQGPKRWETCFNALCRAPGAGDGSGGRADLKDSDLAAVLDLAPRFGVVFDRLSPAARLRRELFQLRQAASRLPDAEGPQAVGAAVAAFQKAASGLAPDAARQPEVAAFLKELDGVTKQEAARGPSFDGIGPQGIPGGKWAAETADGGRTVVFSWAEKGHKLTFARVEPKAGKPCYLCTTEAPVGLFIDVIRAAGKWMAVPGLLEVYSIIDAPKGPRVWEWKRRGIQAAEIEMPRFWLVGETRQGQHYPAGIAPKQPPSDDYPMQYVSAPAALYFAWLLGCRLPTAAEWQAAFEASEKSKADRAANLRDLTWEKQRDFMKRDEGYQIRVPEWPDAGIFWPEAIKDRKVGAAAVVASDRDDGALWFQPAGSGKGFQHLVGNVAEFVLDEPAEQQEKSRTKALALPPEVAGPFLRAAMMRAPGAGDGSGGLSVIGGSALSAPQVWDGKTVPFEKPWPVKFARGALDSFSDVGFRLAFTAPAAALAAPQEAPAVRLKRLLVQRGYLGD